jgi:hypothetical protein
VLARIDLATAATGADEELTNFAIHALNALEQIEPAEGCGGNDP